MFPQKDLMIYFKHFFTSSFAQFSFEFRSGQLTEAPSFRRSPWCLGGSPALQKKLQTPCGQMTKFSGGESRAGLCFAAAGPVVRPWVPPLLSPPLGALLLRRGKVPLGSGPALKSVTWDQGWLTTPVRKTYLHHE